MSLRVVRSAIATVGASLVASAAAGDPITSPASVTIDPQVRSVAVAAAGGDRFLVAWTNAANDIRLVRVEPGGRVDSADPRGEAPLPPPPAGEGRYQVDVASNGCPASGCRYLLVWMQGGGGTLGGIRAALLDGRGRRVERSIVIVGGGVISCHPRVASTGGSYLVVWQQDGCNEDRVDPERARVYAARLSAEGIVDDVGPFEIDPRRRDRRRPAVSGGYDGAGGDAHGYLVAWLEGTSEVAGCWRRFGNWQGACHVRARRMSGSSTAVIGGEIALTAAAAQRSNPSIAYHLGRYLVAWTERRMGRDTWDVIAARVNARSGVVLGGGANVRTGPEPDPAGSAYAANDFGAYWTRKAAGGLRPGIRDVRARPVSWSSGRPIVITRDIEGRVRDDATAFDAASDGCKTLVAFDPEGAPDPGPLQVGVVSLPGSTTCTALLPPVPPPVLPPPG